MNALSQAEYRFILQRDFASLIERAFYELNPGRSLRMAEHIEVIASRLDAVRRGDVRRLIINVPPRHLKSHCASVCFPAWILAHRPSAHIICASYGLDLAEKFARDTRTLMQADWFQELFPVRLAGTNANDLVTTDQGTRLATSVGGTLTGRGADFIVLDDPLKPDDALSDTRRSAANLWFDNTLLSRLNEKKDGCIVIVMQRLHQDDLVGHVLETDAWEVLSFPAIAEDDEDFTIDTPLGSRTYHRVAGSVLHPEREPAATLAGIRQQIGEFSYQSQYQQNPTPIGGLLVKSEWFRFYAPGTLPRPSLVWQSWDTANKATELNNYSVCTTWVSIGIDFYLLDVLRARLNFPDLRRAALENAARWNASTIIIEDKASGTQLIQDLRHEISGVKAYAPPSGMDKVMRLHAQTPVFENGHVWLPTQAAWLSEYMRELMSFPGGKYDDQVDSTTQALEYMRGPSRDLEIWARLGR